MSLRVISDSAGFALCFDEPEDLDVTIEKLQLLAWERKGNPAKSWPAFYGVFAKRVKRAEDPNAEGYARGLLRWLRSRLGKEGAFHG